MVTLEAEVEVEAAAIAAEGVAIATVAVLHLVEATVGATMMGTVLMVVAGVGMVVVEPRLPTAAAEGMEGIVMVVVVVVVVGTIDMGEEDMEEAVDMIVVTTAIVVIKWGLQTAHACFAVCIMDKAGIKA
jgi:membrane-bound ClpP family serine protease